jgi:pyruvate/2-oxoglutarate dehydrogenase complex dihydrolipoamide dehydrogenase (E3) component
VVILEKAEKLGGQIELASMGPHKSRLKWVKDWFVGEVERKEINVRLNTNATIDTIKSYSPDIVLLATGSAPFAPPIPGIENAKNAWDVLRGMVALPSDKTAIVLGGGTVGCEIAEMLADEGNKTYVVEMAEDIAVALEPFHRLHLLADFEENINITVLTNAKVVGIDNGSVSYQTSDSSQKLDGEFIVAAFGQKSCGTELVAELKAAGIPCNIIGDACSPGNFMTATRTAYDAVTSM